MPPVAPKNRRFALLLAFGAAVLSTAAAAPPEKESDQPSRKIVTRFEEPMVDIRRVCPGVIVELRYATTRNLTGKPIYPPGSRALLRKSVAERLNRAQEFVRERGFSLKVWDAYRPAWVQKVLWNEVKDPAYVVEPSSTGSLHNWGSAVDVTLVDVRGREARMPTDFDAFSEAARYDYKGKDPEIAFNLSTLKRAMAQAGFRHIRDEWWHYSVGNVPFGPIEVPLVDPEEKIARAEENEPAEKVEVKAAAPAKQAQAKAAAPAKKAKLPPAKKKPRTKRPLFPPRANEPL